MTDIRPHRHIPHRHMGGSKHKVFRSAEKSLEVKSTVQKWTRGKRVRWEIS